MDPTSNNTSPLTNNDLTINQPASPPAQTVEKAATLSQNQVVSNVALAVLSEEPKSDAPVKKRATISPGAIAIINTGRIISSVVWTVARLGLVLLGTITLILPIAHMIKKRSAKTDKTTEKTADAAAAALKHSNAKKLSKKKAEKSRLDHIANEYENLKNNARKGEDERMAYFEKRNENFEKLFTAEGIKERFPDANDVDLEALQIAADIEVALTLIYRLAGDLSIGTQLKMLVDGQVVLYEVKEYITDKHGEGAHCYCLAPVDPNSNAPIQLLFRGTNFKTFTGIGGRKIQHSSGIKADSRKEIGLKAFKDIEGELQKFINKDENRNRGVALKGHSLGGAIAQIAAAELPPARVVDVSTYNSPKVSARIASKFKPTQKCNVKHIVNDDPVAKVGGSRTKQGTRISASQERNVVFFKGTNHTSKDPYSVCMTGNAKPYSLLTHEEMNARDGIIGRVFDFVRPHLEPISRHQAASAA